MSASAQIVLKFSSRFELRSFNYFFYLFLAACVYFISFVGYSLALRFFALSNLSPLMAVAVMLIVVSVGVFAFNERLSVAHIFGLVFGLVSVVLLSIR
jgi:drug/metabolite transporter (DMT)-like permease